MIDFTRFFRKNKKEYRIPSNLSRKDRKRVERIIKKAQKNDGIPRTAQQTIPFQRMFQDGICRVGKDFYTKTIEFQDIKRHILKGIQGRITGTEVIHGDKESVFLLR